MEVQQFSDECMRLRHVLEEVIASRDPLANPHEVARIEEQFNHQHNIITSMKAEN